MHFVIANRNVVLILYNILDSIVLNNAQVVPVHFRCGVNIDSQTYQHVPESNNLLYSMAHCHKLCRIGGGFHIENPIDKPIMVCNWEGFCEAVHKVFANAILIGTVIPAATA